MKFSSFNNFKSNYYVDPLKLTDTDDPSGNARYRFLRVNTRTVLELLFVDAEDRKLLFPLPEELM